MRLRKVPYARAYIKTTMARIRIKKKKKTPHVPGMVEMPVGEGRVPFFEREKVNKKKGKHGLVRSRRRILHFEPGRSIWLDRSFQKAVPAMATSLEFLFS